jgi:chromosome segregation ATPase
MRLTNASLEKLKSEKQQYIGEATDLKNKNLLLIKKIRTCNDPQPLYDKIDENKKNQLFMDENIANLHGELRLRESKIEALTRELAIAHRSIDVQSKYEKLMTVNPTIYNNRELMRTLYFEMGKKQADLHCITVSLAETTQKCVKLKSEYDQAIELKLATYAENEKLKGNLEYLNRRSMEYTEEIVELQKDAQQKLSSLGTMERTVEDLSSQLIALKAENEELVRSSAQASEDLRSAMAVLSGENELLLTQVASLKASIAQKDDMHKIVEEQLSAEVREFTQRNIEFEDAVQECQSLQVKVEVLRAENFELEQEKAFQCDQNKMLLQKVLSAEELGSKFKASVDAKDANISALHNELTRIREALQSTSDERTEAVEALKQTMKATRDLSQKYHREREAKEALERMNEQLLQAKTNISAATLDALYQERKKTAALEKSLALIPLVLKWRSNCVPEEILEVNGK